MSFSVGSSDGISVIRRSLSLFLSKGKFEEIYLPLDYETLNPTNHVINSKREVI